MSTDTKLTPAEIRTAMIAEKIKKGLKKAQAEEVVDRQLERDAKASAAPRKPAPVTKTDAIHPKVTGALDDHDERIEELEDLVVKLTKANDALGKRIEELEKTAKAK